MGVELETLEIGRLLGTQGRTTSSALAHLVLEPRAQMRLIGMEEKVIAEEGQFASV